MVARQIESRRIADPRVLAAMRKVPRHRFVPDALAGEAYEDRPLAIGHEQTISQPYMVAVMTEALRLGAGQKVLEIGTGSGYQTALLAELGGLVHTVERIEALATSARERLERLGYAEIRYRVGDGTLGWPEAAPFDRIIVTAGAPAVPVALVSQLAEGGLMVIPVGDDREQQLLRLRRERGLVAREALGGCKFVKLLGQEGWENS